MSAILVFDHIEKKHSLYGGEHCMKKFCESLKEHAKYIIGFEKKKMLLLSKKESQRDATESQRCKKFVKKFAKLKNHRRVRDLY